MSMPIEKMRSIVETRSTLQSEIYDLNGRLNDLQKNVKEELISTGFTDALNVNWAMLHRIVRRGDRR